MDIINEVSCTRSPSRAIFQFVNLFGFHNYPVSMVFMPSGVVSVVVGGARYRCEASQVCRVIDDSFTESEALSGLTYSIEAGELDFHIPADVHEQLKAHPEFKQQRVCEHEPEGS
jgi:hypothetical protein